MPDSLWNNMLSVMNEAFHEADQVVYAEDRDNIRFQPEPGDIVVDATFTEVKNV
jgi:hypothetical protein